MPEGAYLGPDNELRIIRAIDDDKGEYQCSAKNSVGTAWSDPIMLNVIMCKLEIKWENSLLHILPPNPTCLTNNLDTTFNLEAKSRVQTFSKAPTSPAEYVFLLYPTFPAGDPNLDTSVQGDSESNKSMISLVTTVSVVLVVIIISIVSVHYYCKRRSSGKVCS